MKSLPISYNASGCSQLYLTVYRPLHHPHAYHLALRLFQRFELYFAMAGYNSIIGKVKGHIHVSDIFLHSDNNSVTSW